MNQAPFVTVDQIALHFAVSPATIRSWVRSGHIPPETYVKVGPTYRFNLPRIVESLLNKPKQLELDLGEDNDLIDHTDNQGEQA